MKTEIPEKNEVGIAKNVLNKCKYSIDGLKVCFKNESSFMLEAIAGIIIIILGIYFDISFVDWVIAFGSLMLITIVELINTAIEATVDLVTSEFHPLAKIAKDCGSAATGVMSILATIVNLIIFLPYVVSFFR